MLGLFFLSDTVLDSAKNVLMPFEPKLLVMCERVGEALEISPILSHVANNLGSSSSKIFFTTLKMEAL